MLYDYKDLYFSDNELHRIKKGTVVKTIKRLNDGNWKTAMAKSKPMIPKDTELEVVGWFSNFYGVWIEVVYKDEKYSINPMNLEVI